MSSLTALSIACRIWAGGGKLSAHIWGMPNGPHGRTDVYI
jgi:hypothetical protein